MKHFLSSEIENSPADKALFHVIPAPMEMSVSSGGGTKMGPGAILEASDQLETWDGFSHPCLKGIHTTEFLESDDPAEFTELIRKRVEKTLDLNKIPVLLGGEHTVSLGAAQAMFDKFGDQIALVQIDAHADLRQDYQGNPYSHASVVRKIHEHTGWKIYQIGIRALCGEEQNYQALQGIHCLSGRDAAARQVHTLELPSDFPENIYLTIDADGLDSSILPATGTPVPGGLQWYQTLDMIESLVRAKNIAGFDFVELAPRKELSYCDFSAAQLIYQVMGMIQRKRDAL